MSGNFGSISAKGMGTRQVRVITLQRRLGIIASADSEAKSRRAFYPVVTTGSSFLMQIAFTSWEERERFNDWMLRYMRSVVNGTAASGVMTVRVPQRDFEKTAIPESDLEFGEGVTDVGYTLDLSFIGASDPVDLNLGQRMAGISYFKGPKGMQESRYFYPGGKQVKGAEQLDGTTFDPEASGGEPFDQQVDQPLTNLPEGI